MGREEGGGFRMGSTGIPVADSFWCLVHCSNLTQYFPTWLAGSLNQKLGSPFFSFMI